MKRMRAAFALLSLVIGIPGLSASQAHAQEYLEAGPKGLIIQYRADRGDRGAFRHYLVDNLAPRLRAMQEAGEIEDFRIFYSWYRQPEVWDGMVTVRFASFEAVQRWNALETGMPGGLDMQGQELAEPVLTSLVDLAWSANGDDLRDGQVFYVIPYEYDNASQYRKYVEGYVLPQFSGWLEAGMLDGYSLYMNRFQVGRPWDVLFIQHYHDMAAFGRREAVKSTVRERLANNAEWVAWSEDKQGIRTETENTIADLIAH